MARAGEDTDPERVAEVPAGGRGADTGAVESARIDESDEADIPNISSQNDVPGVGTRAGDGSMESDRTVRRRDRAAAAPVEATDEGRDPAASDAETGLDEEGHPDVPEPSDMADLPVESYQPGVDPESARSSRLVNDDR